MSSPENPHILHSLILAQIPYSRILRAWQHFGQLEALLSAPAGSLSAFFTTSQQASWNNALKNIDKEVHQLQSQNINLLCLSDSKYPKLLAQISDPPLLLYYRGALPNSYTDCISIVGTRSATSYGSQAATSLSQTLARAGLTIISGLAYGIDSLAHKSAVAQNTPTLAILASGVDTASIYPRAHKQLAEQIISAGGGLISEYPPGTEPRKHHFIARNRIIAGLSPTTLVIEAPLKSGALITAQFALEENRCILSLPGPITSVNSAGTNQLIKDGAILILSTQDLLETLNISSPATTTPSLNPIQTAILKALQTEPLDADTLISKFQISAAELNSHLSTLEIKGLITQNETGYQNVKI